jgi:hypothetical protein
MVTILRQAGEETMVEITPILIARVIHILSSTMWAGFIIVIGLGHTRGAHGESPQAARTFRRTVTGRAARIVPPAAFVSVISGAYLFAELRKSFSVSGEAALILGATAALLFFPTIALLGRPAELRLAALDAQNADARETGRLNRRVLFAAYTAVTLMATAAITMAAARYL